MVVVMLVVMVVVIMLVAMVMIVVMMLVIVMHGEISFACLGLLQLYPHRPSMSKHLFFRRIPHPGLRKGQKAGIMRKIMSREKERNYP
jgi:hypothetical protein